jgi:hypothetical protein
MKMTKTKFDCDWDWTHFLIGIEYSTRLKRLCVYILFFVVWVDFPKKIKQPKWRRSQTMKPKTNKDDQIQKSTWKCAKCGGSKINDGERRVCCVCNVWYKGQTPEFVPAKNKK